MQEGHEHKLSSRSSRDPPENLKRLHTQRQEPRGPGHLEDQEHLALEAQRHRHGELKIGDDPVHARGNLMQEGHEHKLSSRAPREPSENLKDMTHLDLHTRRNRHGELVIDDDSVHTRDDLMRKELDNAVFHVLDHTPPGQHGRSSHDGDPKFRGESLEHGPRQDGIPHGPGAPTHRFSGQRIRSDPAHVRDALSRDRHAPAMAAPLDHPKPDQHPKGTSRVPLGDGSLTMDHSPTLKHSESSQAGEHSPQDEAHVFLTTGGYKDAKLSPPGHTPPPGQANGRDDEHLTKNKPSEVHPRESNTAGIIAQTAIDEEDRKKGRLARENRTAREAADRSRQEGTALDLSLRARPENKTIQLLELAGDMLWYTL
jgi:hypothetical protein